MQIKKIENYSQRLKVHQQENNQHFGNFIVLKFPFSDIPSYYFSPKKNAKAAMNIITKLTEEIKTLTKGQINLYMRGLKNMSFRENI